MKKEQPVFGMEVVRYCVHLKMVEFRNGGKRMCESKEIINCISGTATWVLVRLRNYFLKLGKVVALQMS
jgi:hypothetical protein